MKTTVESGSGAKTMAMAGAPADNKKIRIKKLSEALADQSYVVREWALKTLLLEVKDEEVKQTLIGIAKDKNNAASERVEQELKVLGIKTDEK